MRLGANDSVVCSELLRRKTRKWCKQGYKMTIGEEGERMGRRGEDPRGLFLKFQPEKVSHAEKLMGFVKNL